MKKTMSVTVMGVTHHLVSYYSVEDVMRGILNPPSMVESLRYSVPALNSPRNRASAPRLTTWRPVPWKALTIPPTWHRMDIAHR